MKKFLDSIRKRIIRLLGGYVDNLKTAVYKSEIVYPTRVYSRAVVYNNELDEVYTATVDRLSCNLGRQILDDELCKVETFNDETSNTTTICLCVDVIKPR